MKNYSISFLLMISFFQTTFSQSVFPIKKENRWGIMDSTGKIILEPTYDYISEFNHFNWAIARKNDFFALINYKGKQLLPPVYEKINVLSDTHLAVWKTGLCALADINNKLLTVPSYDKIMFLSKGLFRIKKESLYGVLNDHGKELLPCDYDKIDFFEESNNFTYIIKGDKKGLINRTGVILLNTQYDKIQTLNNFIKAYKGRNIELLILDERGNLKNRKKFINEAAYKQAQKAQLNKKNRELLQSDPNANQPRWQQYGYIFRLTNAVQKNLLGIDFYAIDEDEKTGLALGISENQQNEVESYLIEKKLAKIIFKTSCKDIIITDFRVSQYARASVDTLWDALVDKRGNIKKTLSHQGKSFLISNIGNFDNDLIWFRSGKYFGLMNKQSLVIVPPMYEKIRNYIKNYAAIKQNGKYGIINKKGKFIIPIVYNAISDYEQGLFRVQKENKWGVINTENKLVIPFEYDLIGIFKNGVAKIKIANKYGYITTKGNYDVKPAIYCDDIGEFSHGIAWIGRGKQTHIGKNKQTIITYQQHGYVDKEGKFIIRPEYESIGDFKKIWGEEKGIVKITKKNKIGFINYKGKLVIDAIYDEVYNFEKIWSLNKGFSLVKKDGKYGYIDHNGLEILPIIYNFIDKNFQQVLTDSIGITKAKKGNKYGYIDYQGKAVIPFLYEEIGYFQNGVAIANKKGKWGLINEKNFPVIKFLYDGIRFIENSEGKFLKLLKRETLYYYIDREGNTKYVKQAKEIDPSEAKPYRNPAARSPKFVYKTDYDRNNLAIVKKNNKQAIIDTQGNLITKYAYINILPFSESLAGAKVYNKDRSKQKFGFINTSGEWVIAPTYDKVKSFSDGKASIFINRKWGYINKKGDTIIPPQFEDGGFFSEGKALVNKNIIVNDNGKEIGKFKLKGNITGICRSDRFKVETPTGAYHIKSNGLPAYYSKYDEITDFNGKVAFVKKGELWELTREKGLKEFKLKFSKASKNLYIEKYGNRRKQKDNAGKTLRDIAWKKIAEGTWKMIDRYGNFLTKTTYSEAIQLEDGNFRLKVDELYGVVDTNGKFISRPENHTLKLINNHLLRIESENKIGFFDIKKGIWLWEKQ